MLLAVQECWKTVRGASCGESRNTKVQIIEYGEERKMHGHCQSVLKLFGREFARCLNAIKQRTGLLS